MKHLLFLLLSVVASCCHALPDRASVLRFFKTHPPKQDILMNGATAIKGTQRDISTQRLALIKKVVNQYKRPFMVADLDPQWGYCSFCIARDYPAICVMIDEGVRIDKKVKKTDLLTALCVANERLSGLVLLEAKRDRKHLIELSKCEHFDVVLASDLLCRAGSQWRAFAEVILDIGEMIFIEVPAVDDQRGKSVPDVLCSTREIKSYIERNGGSLVGTFGKKSVEQQMYVLYRKKTSIKNCCLNDSHWHPSHQITSDFYKKIFYKGSVERQWYSGINIMTFRGLHGRYPLEKVIFKKFEEISPFAPKGANVLIQGKSLLVLPA